MKATGKHQTRKSSRLFHVIESLDNNAVESWLIRIFQRASKEYPGYEWTFFCTLPEPGEFDGVVTEYGGKVIHSVCEIGNKLRFLTSLRKVMRAGHYDVLHCHHDVMSAAYLTASIGLPFRQRIVHLHNTSLSLPTPSRIKSDLAREPMRQVCLQMADQIVGSSRDALESLVGTKSHDPERHRVVHYGIDTRKFASPKISREELRRQLGVNGAAKVLLFVGRIVDYKNPQLVIEILEQLLKIDTTAVAVFAGKGNLETDLRRLIEQKNLMDKVRLLGFRDDVPELMLACDVLIWPSLETPKEGLGLGIIEAQAAGLPVVMSRSVPAEAIVIPELVRTLPLVSGAAAWAFAVAQILSSEVPTRAESLARINESTFSMRQGLENFMKLYGSFDEQLALSEVSN